MPRSNFTYEYKALLYKIKQARIDAGLTQKQVADKLDRHQSFVSKIESGERRIDVIELAEFSKLYRVNLNMMLSDVLSAQKPKKKRT